MVSFYFYCAFCIPQVPFALEFESERPNNNSATKQLPNNHSSNLEKSVKRANDNLRTKHLVNHRLAIQLIFLNLTNGNLATVLSPNYHSAVHTQTQNANGT